MTVVDEPVEQTAKVTFEIPAYMDKNTGKPFAKTIEMPTRKAYAIYKRIISSQQVQ